MCYKKAYVVTPATGRSEPTHLQFSCSKHMEAVMTLDFSVTLVCVVVVAFCAASRYNTPETNRFSTTRSLFWLTTIGYVAASLAVFFRLCEVVLKPGVLSFLGLDHAQEIIAKYSAPPVLAAALLT